MVTIGDLYTEMGKVQRLRDMFGTEEEFEKEYQRRKEELVEAIRTEHNIPNDVPFHPSENAPLGEKSEHLFYELRNWIASQEH
jgi:uncharacterized protein YabN with tetrapyrrole methylase and pyrophosphatase domain